MLSRPFVVTHLMVTARPGVLGTVVAWRDLRPQTTNMSGSNHGSWQ
jgi:hypothetical protein